MATAVSTERERRVAVAVTMTLIGITLLGSLFADVRLPEIGAFLPIYTTLACGADALTAFLLFGQARANRRPSLNVLGLAYAYSTFAIVAHVLVFPHVFSPTGLFGATTQTAVWFWVWWHGGFPLFVTAYVAVDERLDGDKERHVPAVLPMLGVALLGCAVAVLLGVTLRADAVLPHLIVAGDYHALLESGVGPAVVVVSLVAIASLAVVTRLRFVTHIWLAVALVAMLLDILLTLEGGGRYSFGWYVARLESLVAAFVVLVSLLGAISRLYEQIARVATIDGLTGAYNRRAFDERIAAVRAGSIRAATPFAVVMIDVDLFKSYNDAYGHVAGDQCLRLVAAACVRSLGRRSDFLARYGGEEFAILLPGTDDAGALRVAERVRTAIASSAVAHAASPRGHVTASLGTFAFDPSRERDLGPAEIVERADAALYAAKRDGRDRVVAYRALARDGAPHAAALI